MNLSPSQQFFQALEKASLPSAGVVLVDKPSGMTSHDVVAIVRRLTKVKRVGHAGTLDPLASGLLIILIGREFTKLQDSFMHQDKTYTVTAQLGVTTDSYDSDGQVISQVGWEEVSKLTQPEVEAAMKTFIGDQLQTVPHFSAVKVDGHKLYESAHRGEAVPVELPQKKISIDDFRLTNWDRHEIEQTLSVSATVSCSPGTYIRSLMHDLGQKIGVGATVTALRRTHIGSHIIPDSTVAVIDNTAT